MTWTDVALTTLLVQATFLQFFYFQGNIGPKTIMGKNYYLVNTSKNMAKKKKNTSKKIWYLSKILENKSISCLEKGYGLILEKGYGLILEKGYLPKLSAHACCEMNLYSPIFVFKYAGAAKWVSLCSYVKLIINDD